MKAQRLRLTFARHSEAGETSHREMMQALERAMKDAGLPLAYSEGRRPTAQISIGAPLALGVTAARDLADLFLSERVAPERFLESLKATLAPGLAALAVEEIGLDAPALQTELRWAEYEVDVASHDLSAAEVRDAISRLLTSSTIPWEHQRENKVQRYDLRPLVLSLGLEAEGEGLFRLGMRLRTAQERSGRADQVVAALGLPAAQRIHRRRLYVDRTPAPLRAHRRSPARD